MYRFLAGGDECSATRAGRGCIYDGIAEGVPTAGAGGEMDRLCAAPAGQLFILEVFKY